MGGKGVIYLMSQGCPTEFGLQVGKAQGVGGGGEYFYFFCFFTFIHFALSPLSLIFISSTILSLFSLSLGDHKMTRSG